MSSKAKRDELLSVENWRDAALHALAEGGVAAVAIEPLAKQLGVTKGSGYWHFENRDALLRAALEAWETKTTESVIAKLGTIAEPRERLVALFRQAFTGTLDSRVYAALAAADQHALVAASLRKVARRRLEFLSECYRGMGFTPARARHRAIVAYAAYLGVIMLRRHATDLIDARDRESFLDHLIETVV